MGDFDETNCLHVITMVQLLASAISESYRKEYEYCQELKENLGNHYETFSSLPSTQDEHRRDTDEDIEAYRTRISNDLPQLDLNGVVFLNPEQMLRWRFGLLNGPLPKPIDLSEITAEEVNRLYNNGVSFLELLGEECFSAQFPWAIRFRDIEAMPREVYPPTVEEPDNADYEVLATEWFLVDFALCPEHILDAIKEQSPCVLEPLEEGRNPRSLVQFQIFPAPRNMKWIDSQGKPRSVFSASTMLCRVSSIHRPSQKRGATRPPNMHSSETTLIGSLTRFKQRITPPDMKLAAWLEAIGRRLLDCTRANVTTIAEELSDPALDLSTIFDEPLGNRGLTFLSQRLIDVSALNDSNVVELTPGIHIPPRDGVYVGFDLTNPPYANQEPPLPLSVRPVAPLNTTLVRRNRLLEDHTDRDNLLGITNTIRGVLQRIPDLEQRDDAPSTPHSNNVVFHSAVVHAVASKQGKYFAKMLEEAYFKPLAGLGSLLAWRIPDNRIIIHSMFLTPWVNNHNYNEYTLTQVLGESGQEDEKFRTETVRQLLNNSVALSILESVDRWH